MRREANETGLAEIARWLFGTSDPWRSAAPIAKRRSKVKRLRAGTTRSARTNTKRTQREDASRSD
jgi:hypothetical protein